MLKKRPQPEPPSEQDEEDEEDYYDEEEDDYGSEMDDFIVKDDEEDLDGQQVIVQKYLSAIKRKIGAKELHSESGSSSDMEAGYDDIQNEEKRSMKIARKEDALQLRMIEEEERRDRSQKERRKRRKIDSDQSD